RPRPREGPRILWKAQAMLIFGGNHGGTDFNSNPAWIPGTLPVLPTITAQPQGLTVLAGTNVVLSVVATGSFPINYQWTHNHTNIAGADEASLALDNVQIEDDGEYSVVG